MRGYLKKCKSKKEGKEPFFYVLSTYVGKDQIKEITNENGETIFRITLYIDKEGTAKALQDSEGIPCYAGTGIEVKL